MEPVVIHYADDDTDDLLLFKSAVDKSPGQIALHTYNRSDEFLKNIKARPTQNAIVFLDINMPGKSGFDVLREIRRDDLLKKMPVIMYSTSSDASSISMSRETGATMYAIKPNSFSDLKNMIKKAVTINWDLFQSPPQNFVLNMT